jgi:flagellar hook protein FlgE
MSFRISLTGMNAALAELGVPATTSRTPAPWGSKNPPHTSRVWWPSWVADGPTNATGRGAILQGDTANFSQGGLTTTGNALDLALEGDGFFIVQTNAASPADPERLLDGYTRNGSFRVDADGYLVDTSGRRLKTDANTTSEQGLVRIPSSVGLPRASSNIGLDVNLPSDATVKPITPKNSVRSCRPDQLQSIDLGAALRLARPHAHRRTLFP